MFFYSPYILDLFRARQSWIISRINLLLCLFVVVVVVVFFFIVVVIVNRIIFSREN